MADPTSRGFPDATRRNERARRAILAAALSLVDETGYPGLSIEALAGRAGVGKQTIYRWWPSKAAVLLDACQGLDEAHPDGPEPSPAPDTADLAADLKRMLRATVDELTGERYGPPLRALAAAAACDPVLAAGLTDRLLAPRHARFERRLRTARAAGELAADADLPLVTELLLGSLAYRWLMGRSVLGHADADALVDHVLRGVSAP
ncbi:TetR/AcrR family transcriptional regulator [Streptomyces sp. NPDC006879]|uniref:TetR/AcrR family transcriptional regulator n=1 Tax=Streptomyces sp. NPDC006879 TaxID=3364767 RepID=UPI00369E6BAF